MASGSFFTSMLLFGKSNEEEDHVNIQQDMHVGPQAQSPTVPIKRRRNPHEIQYPDAEVIALSPTTLMAKNRFVCEICGKGFPRDQNLQLHKRGHNLPWKLKQKSPTDEVKRKVYLCPEPSCINHEPSHALGDLTGIKKHYSRKHGEKKYKCQKCEKMYAVKSDLKAHLKTCGTKEYQCHCGTIFSRRDSFINHRAFCDALITEVIPTKSPIGVNSTQNLIGNNLEIPQNVSHLGQKIHNSVTIKTKMDMNYYKSPTPSFEPSSHEQNQHNYKYHGNFDSSFFTNLMNNTSTPHKNMQLYNHNFMGNPINHENGEGSSLFSGGSIVSHHSSSLYLSSHTGVTPQISATGLLQKAFVIGSTSSTNTENVKSLFGSSHFGNSGSNDHHSDMNELFNQYIGVSNDHKDSDQGGLDSGDVGYDGVKTTRDFLGVGVEIVGNMSNDEPKSTFAARSFV